MERTSGQSPTKHANSNPKPAVSALNPAKATGSDTTPSGGNTNSQSNPTATGDVNTGNTTAAASQKAQLCLVREQDQYMPIANVIRIMRRILPPHAKISDDAKETIQECVSEYIAFVTGEANERCQREQRKTVTAEDILWAIGKLGFDNYVEPLALFLHKYRESENSDRSALRGEFIKRERGMEFGPVGPHLMLPPPPPPYYGPGFPFGGKHGHRMIDPSMAALFRDVSSSGGGGAGSSSSSGARYQNLAGGFDPFSQFK